MPKTKISTIKQEREREILIAEQKIPCSAKKKTHKTLSFVAHLPRKKRKQRIIHYSNEQNKTPSEHFYMIIFIGFTADMKIYDV